MSTPVPQLAKSEEGKVFFGRLLQTGYSARVIRLRRSMLIVSAILLAGMFFDVLPKEVPSLKLIVSRADMLLILTIILAVLILEYIFTASIEFHALRKLPELNLEPLKDFLKAEENLATMRKYNRKTNFTDQEREEHYAATVGFWKPGDDPDQYFRAMIVAAGDSKTIREAKRSYLLKVYYEYASTMIISMSCLLIYLWIKPT